MSYTSRLPTPGYLANNTVNTDINTIWNPLSGSKHTQHHGNLTLSGKRCQMRSATTQLRDNSCHTR